MSSRKRRAKRKLLLGARAYAQYVSAFALRKPCAHLFVVYRVRWMKVRGPGVGQYYRAYLFHRGIDPRVIFHG